MAEFGGEAQRVDARSVVFDIFGDYVRESGGHISLQKLTSVLGHFGVPADSARVVMSRLTREGWFDVRREGRASIYAPSTKGWELLDSGLERIMAPPPDEPWHGVWHMVIFNVPEKNRAVRVRLKTRLSWLSFGQLAPSTWISPHDRLEAAEAELSADPSVRYDLFEARSKGLKSDVERAAQCWDLAGLAKDYEAFTAHCSAIVEAGPGAVSGRDALIGRTELVHEYRKFPFRDPRLPRDLLPAGWPAAKAHAAFLSAFTMLHEEAVSFLQQVTAD